MKAGIYDPYLDTIGGGERYALTLAETLLKNGWKVDLFWKDKKIKQKLIDKFSLAIDKINFISYSPKGNNLFTRRKIEQEYDLLFYFSDGSIPFMFGKNNWLHFQVPFKNSLKTNWRVKLKLRNIRQIICNSFFTKNIIDSCLGVNSTVVYPPVDVCSFKKFKKGNIILSVGRFSQLLQGKRQDVLVSVFKEMSDRQAVNGWKFILAGGSEIGAKEYLEELRREINGFPIEIIENLSFKELVKLYGQAKIFWSASGFDIDEQLFPERVEHFGMTTVEAMASGCVPVVLGKGGQKEIINHGADGFLWHTVDDLKDITLSLIADKEKLEKISEIAIKGSRQYSKEKFEEKISELLK